MAQNEARDWLAKHDIHKLMKDMASDVLLDRPALVTDYLMEWLKINKRPSPRLIVHGPPGAGKGTMSEFIKDEFAVAHLSTGEILRAEVAKKSALGLRAEAFMTAGELVPDDLLVPIIVARLNQPDTAKRGWLLDGFPRKSSQAKALVEAGLLPDLVVLLEVPDDVLKDRILNRVTDSQTGAIYNLVNKPPPADIPPERLVKRSDDTEETLTRRLKKYHEESERILSEFEGNVQRVPAAGAPAEVWALVKATIDAAVAAPAKN